MTLVINMRMIISLVISFFIAQSIIAQERLPSLPDGEIIYDDTGEEEGILFSKREYREIISLYNDLLLFSSNDKLWRKMHTATLELKRIQHERLTLCLETKNSLEITADDMYSLWQEEHQAKLSLEEEQQKKKVLTGVTGVLSGAAIGAAITALLILLL